MLYSSNCPLISQGECIDSDQNMYSDTLTVFEFVDKVYVSWLLCFCVWYVYITFYAHSKQVGSFVSKDNITMTPTVIDIA